MDFTFIEDVLGYSPDLRILERNSQPYYALLYQHTSTLQATPDHIGNIPGDANAATQLNSFFQLAKETGADLVMTPEYSCSWSVIEDIVSNHDRWPAIRSLWAIGAESIRKDQLLAFKQKHHSGVIRVHFDESLLTEKNTFFDPLIYLLHSSAGNSNWLDIVIQFKTNHMSVWNGGQVEANNIILGKKIYVLRNAADSIHFLTLICSEAMNFAEMLDDQNRQKLGWLDRPYLIANPQANGNPIHPRFTGFRTEVMGRENKEIISLNWAATSKLGTALLINGESSRSGHFMRSSEFDHHDENKIRINHAKGLYYFNYGIANRHAFILNSELNAFLMRIPAVNIAGVVAQQSRRDGPILHKSYSFNTALKLIEAPTPVADSSIKYLTDVACSNAFLHDPEMCILEKERLVCLTACEIEKGTSEWYILNNLFSLRTEETSEVNRRITYAEDVSGPSAEQRRKYVKALTELAKILSGQRDKFPYTLSKFRETELIVSYHQTKLTGLPKEIVREKFKFNVTDLQRRPVQATICYLDYPTTKELNERFDKIQAIFGDHPLRGRVVIFYSHDRELLVKYDLEAGKITATMDNLGPSILNQ